MAQIISLLVSIAIAVAIFRVIGEIRRETARLSENARTWSRQSLPEDRAETIPATVTSSVGQS
ncbi:hypothetical protein ASG11_06910 [Sphingomonas sp. Leaf357]|nr:hypothetical protein ASG11_06910 [Sphingomonas sp. Leaf357]